VQPLLPALFWLLPAEGMRMKSCLFLSPPYREALNQRNKKKPKGKGNFTKKKIPPPKKYFPGDFFELPLPRNAQKST
jgi:hypothetical protein